MIKIKRLSKVVLLFSIILIFGGCYDYNELNSLDIISGIGLTFSDNEYKVSLRSKKKIDVARIAADFGGGGHVRAAGFSAKGNVHSIVNKIGEMIEQQYNEDNA